MLRSTSALTWLKDDPGLETVAIYYAEAYSLPYEDSCRRWGAALALSDEFDVSQFLLVPNNNGTQGWKILFQRGWSPDPLYFSDALALIEYLRERSRSYGAGEV